MRAHSRPAMTSPTFRSVFKSSSCEELVIIRQDLYSELLEALFTQFTMAQSKPVFDQDSALATTIKNISAGGLGCLQELSYFAATSALCARQREGCSTRHLYGGQQRNCDIREEQKRSIGDCDASY